MDLDKSETTADHRYKYCDKELDKMHGLDWYDSSARYYDHVLGRFHQMDPLAGQYYPWSPYAYCHSNPINRIDPIGMDDYYTYGGQFLFHEDNKTDNIIIRNEFAYSLKQMTGAEWITPDKPIGDVTLSAEAYSNIFTDILSKMDDVNVDDLLNSKVAVTVFGESHDNLEIKIIDSYNNANNNGDSNADIQTATSFGKPILTAYIFPKIKEERNILTTVSNIQNLLGAHEYLGHLKHGWHSHAKVYPFQKQHSSWRNTTSFFKQYMIDVYEK